MNDLLSKDAKEFNSMDDFWAVINAQLAELQTATTADDVLRILAHERQPGHLTAGDGFFAGSGGDGTVSESLLEAGWEIIWSEASYFYVAQAPDGSVITYIEGDIYKGDRRSGSAADAVSKEVD